MPRLSTLLILVLTVSVFGCDTTAPPAETKVVVEAYLQGGAPMAPIRLTRSAGTDEPYVTSEAAVRNATVEVQRLNDDGLPAETIPFTEQEPGLYRPEAPPRVHPRTIYELSVITSDGTTITATTAVPDTISIVDARHTDVVYQGPEQPTFEITAPQSARTQQDVLVLTTTSLLDFGRPEVQLRDRLTPFYAEDYDPEEDSIEAFRTTSSGVLNEANFRRDAAGRIATRLPWISVAFFGPNEAAVHVIDANLFDLIRSQQAQSPGGSGGGLGPGEIPNVIEHVEGGTGIFGSYVRARQQVFIRRPDDS